jgi:hypothetical protein
MSSSAAPLRRSPRLLELAKKSQIENMPVFIPAKATLTPQQEHIQVSYIIRDMVKIRPLYEAPKEVHAAYARKWLDHMAQMTWKNTKIRLINELFWYLNSVGRVLLSQNVKFRETVMAKIAELDESIYRMPDSRYKTDFYYTAAPLVMTIEMLSSTLGKYKFYSQRVRAGL